MMPTSKKIREIKIEIEKVRVISNLKKPRTGCEQCQTDVDFLSLSETTKTFEINEFAIFQLAKAEQIHLKLNPANEVCVCLQSLLLALNSF